MRARVLIAALALGACAIGPSIAPSPPGSYLVVLSTADASLWAIEPNSGHVKDRFPTGIGPHEVAVSGDGRWAVVANYGDGTHEGHTLSVYDLVERRHEREIDLAPRTRPRGIAFLDRRSTVLVTAEDSGEVLQVSIRSGKVERAIAAGGKGTHTIALRADRKRAYTTNPSSDCVSLLDLETGTLVRTAAIGHRPGGIALTPDGRELWVGLDEDASVVVLDALTLASKASIHGLPLPLRVKATRDGRLVLVSCAASGEVVMLDAATKSVLARLSMEKVAATLGHPVPPGFAPGSPVPVDIVIDPDSRQAFVALTAADRVAVIDLAERRVRGHLDTGREPHGMAWSLQRNAHSIDGPDPRD